MEGSRSAHRNLRARGRHRSRGDGVFQRAANAHHRCPLARRSCVGACASSGMRGANTAALSELVREPPHKSVYPNEAGRRSLFDQVFRSSERTLPTLCRPGARAGYDCGSTTMNARHHLVTGVGMESSVQSLIRRLAPWVLLLAVAACEARAPDEAITGTVEGHYTWGAEVNAFTPCRSDKEYWVVAEPEVAAVLREWYTTVGLPAYSPVYASFKAPSGPRWTAASARSMTAASSSPRHSRSSRQDPTPAPPR